MTPDRLREEVMLKNPTLNDITIFSAVLIPKTGTLDAIPIDSDYPFVDQ